VDFIALLLAVYGEYIQLFVQCTSGLLWLFQ